MSADCKLRDPSFLGLNSVTSHEEGDIIFTGGSAAEAEDFIFAIKWQAYLKGKHKDNTWAAEYASVRFARKALRWYEKLDVETQNDWNLLKRAILDEYAEDQLSSSMVPTSVPIPPSSVPSMITPAASPIRTGRIRVESECSDTRGYIANTFYDTNCCIIGPNQSAAAIFEFDLSTRTIKFQGTPDDYLIIRAYQSDWDIRKGSNHWSAIVKNKGRSVVPKPPWSNDIQFDPWSMLNESKLVGRWPLKAGGFWELEGATYKQNKRIYLTPDSQEFAKHHGVDNFKLLTLYFEIIA